MPGRSVLHPHRLKGALASIFFTLVLFAGTRATAEVFCVDTEGELHSALLSAETNGADDIVQIVQGTYLGGFVYSSYEVYGLAVEGGYLDNCLSRELNPANTVLDGGNASPPLAITSDQAVSFTIEGLTFQNGLTDVVNHGGGLYLYSNRANIRLNANIFQNNGSFASSNSEGGGFYVERADTIIVTNNVVRNNRAQKNGAGGVLQGCQIITLSDNEFSGNESTGGSQGVGLYVWVGDAATITGNRFVNNTNTTTSGSCSGAGLYVRDINQVSLSDNTISGNIAATRSNAGGGAYFSLIDNLALRGNTIAANTAAHGTAFGGSGSAGGLRIGGVDTIVMVNNVIRDNIGGTGGDNLGRGGGIYIDRPNSLTLVNNSIVNNRSLEAGGGLWLTLQQEQYFAEIHNNIIWGNTAVSGGDLWIDNDRDDDYFYATVDLFHNDFDASAAGFWIAKPNFPLDGSNLNIDPLFSSPVDLHLQTLSPVIDAGDNAAPEIPVTDKDGNARIFDGNGDQSPVVDMGAYEYGAVVCVDSDGDGFYVGDICGVAGDCDDTSGLINPGATEICDGIDNDCDGLIDDDDSFIIGRSTWFRDSDGDTFGDPNATIEACLQPDGYVDNSGDCDDQNGRIHPGATEICDGSDNDCDGLTDDDDSMVSGQNTWFRDSDRDTFGDPDITIDACNQPAGYVDNSGDCNDQKSRIHPGATEICDSLDNDCDSLIDDDDPAVTGQSTWFADSDGDTFGDPDVTMDACNQPAGYVDNSNDCDDRNNQVHPGATEICDGLDNDCDGTADEVICPLTAMITANNQSGAVSIPRGESLSIRINLSAGNLDGKTVDWWVVARTPFAAPRNYYHYNLATGTWTPGMALSGQGPCTDYGPKEILRLSRLPVGNYTFYFGVDTLADGRINLGHAYYNFVKVKVMP